MSITQDDVLTKQKNVRRLIFLIITRIFIITLFLGITIFIDVKKQLLSIDYVTINFFYLIVIIIYFFSAVYIFLHKFKVNYKINLYLQITVDILAVTSLIFMFGNTQIDYSLLYTLVIIYSAIFLAVKADYLSLRFPVYFTVFFLISNFIIYHCHSLS